jgi:prevent-host-death family protein
MDKLSVSEAKEHFADVVSRAEQGKQTVITKRGRPVARVVPERSARPQTWDRSEAVRRIVAFSKTCRLPRKLDLAKLIEEGRL